ncbi:unnamed protein product, partial [Dicrocoelium dendriticum]
MSSNHLKHSAVCALTTSSGKLFQSFTTRVDKVTSERRRILLGLNSFIPWPRVELSAQRRKNSCTSSPISPRRIRR